MHESEGHERIAHARRQPAQGFRRGFVMLFALRKEKQGVGNAAFHRFRLERRWRVPETPHKVVGFGKLAQPIRVAGAGAVSGTTVSPQIIDTLILIGRERTIARIKNCSNQCSS